MSKRKPWKVHKTGHVILPDGNTIAIPCIDGEDNRAALSIMIAAAPETAAERDRLKALNEEMLKALMIADLAINPTDKIHVSMHDWNNRLKAATLKIRIAISASEIAKAEGKDD